MTQLDVRPAGSLDPAGRAHHARRALGAGFALALVITTVFAVRALGGGATQTRRTPTSASAAGAATPAIAALQKRVTDVPKDWSAWAGLGAAYVQQARLTEDSSYYPKAQEALERSLTLKSNANLGAFIGMGSLAAARHHFSDALAWGRRATKTDRYSATAYGVVGDALTELGRYPEAFDALQRMVDLRPGLSSYSRASYSWELQGNGTNAIKALELALQAAPTPEDAAFASYYLGELYWNSGRVSLAERFYQRSASLSSKFLPASQGLAKTAVVHGDLPRAISLYEELIARFPSPQYTSELADLYELAGRPDRAAEMHRLLVEQQEITRANGEDVDLEVAIYSADHGYRLRQGLAAAQREWGRRHAVVVADALAWSLYMNHRYSEALTYTHRALHLGTHSALFYFHKGMIERAVGEVSAARADLSRALDINPNFSFRWATHARATLESLR